MCFTCIEGIRECKHHSGPYLHNIHKKVSTASKVCAYASQLMLLVCFVYTFISMSTHICAPLKYIKL